MKNKNLFNSAWPCLAAALFALCLVFAGCGGDEEKEPVNTGPNFAGLQAALTPAEQAIAGVLVSVDGSDLGPNNRWVTQATYTALQRAINTAKGMLGPPQKGTTAQVDAAIAALQTATAAFNAEVTIGTGSAGPDFEGLQAALTPAEAAREGVWPSEDGSELGPNNNWVPQEIWTALDRAIRTAKGMLSTSPPSGTTAQVSAAITALQEATAAFIAAISTGTGDTDVGDDPYEVLEVVLTTAEAAVAHGEELGVVISFNGSEVDADKYWVTGVLQATLDACITLAKQYLGPPQTATPEEAAGLIITLREATQNFLSGIQRGNGASAADIAEDIEALLQTVPDIKKYTDSDGVKQNVQLADEEIEILFKPWGVWWVAKAASLILDSQVVAAEAFLEDIDGTTPTSEARAIKGALQAAIDDYKAKKKEGCNMVFVDVPAGRFTRYAGTESLGTTGYETRITYSYKIAKYPLTVGQWEFVMGTAWSGGRYDSSRSTNPTYNNVDRSRFPAVRLSWYDAVAFCNKLSVLAGRTRPYKVTGVADDAWRTITGNEAPSHHPDGLANNGGGSRNANWSGASHNLATNAHITTLDSYRLPTEHEWQWAAMGAYSDTTATYTNGTATASGALATELRINTTGYRKTYSGQKANTTQDDGRGGNGTGGTRAGMVAYARVWWATANPTSTSLGSPNYAGTIPVGSLLPNELQIYDMSGNVSEWCFDTHTATGSGNNLGLPATTNPQTDYYGTGTPQDRGKIGHGGDWFNFANGTAGGSERPSVWNRTGYYEYIGYDTSGFRLVTTGE